MMHKESPGSVVSQRYCLLMSCAALSENTYSNVWVSLFNRLMQTTECYLNSPNIVFTMCHFNVFCKEETFKKHYKQFTATKWFICCGDFK